MRLLNNNIYYKTVLITGISSGIGAEMAKYYARNKCIIFGCARNNERLQQVKQECLSLGAEKVDFRIIDVTDQAKIKEWISEIIIHTKLDLIIANAGISAGTLGGQEGETQINQIFDINLHGTLNIINSVINHFIEQKKGQIAIISSLAGLRGLPSCPSYSASKGAVRIYGEALRGSLKKYNIGVTVVLPGYVHSGITKHNQFPMPFIMNADKAAKIICDKLNYNPARIAFPKILYILVLLLSFIPIKLSDYICSKLPGKKSLDNV